MSNKDFFHLGKALDLTVPQRKIVIKTKVHIVSTTKVFYVHTRGIGCKSILQKEMVF